MSKEATNDVLVERIENFKEYIRESVEHGFSGIHRRFDENKEEHKGLDVKVTLTNGRVRMLEKWRWGIGGVMTVIVFVSSYALRDYFNFKQSFYQNDKNTAVILEKLNQQDSEIKDIKDQHAQLLKYLAQYNIRIEQ